MQEDPFVKHVDKMLEDLERDITCPNQSHAEDGGNGWWIWASLAISVVSAVVFLI
jgi:hypothetical protein